MDLPEYLPFQVKQQNICKSKIITQVSF